MERGRDNSSSLWMLGRYALALCLALSSTLHVLASVAVFNFPAGSVFSGAQQVVRGPVDVLTPSLSALAVHLHHSTLIDDSNIAPVLYAYVEGVLRLRSKGKLHLFLVPDAARGTAPLLKYVQDIVERIAMAYFGSADIGSMIEVEIVLFTFSYPRLTNFADYYLRHELDGHF
jgi:hypothetical protein